MSDAADDLYGLFSSVGGVRTVRAGGDPDDPADGAWNFGVAPSSPSVRLSQGPPLWDVFPKLRGKWDGRTTVNHHEAARKVLGRDLKPHRQRSGTCGGHAGGRALELLQCCLIAGGRTAMFKPVSHAWIYYLARREYGMLGRGDGVPDGSVPPVLARYGALHRVEAGDPDQDGDGVDLLADAWGRGELTGGQLLRLENLARDNPVTAMVRCRSADELADAIAAGGVGCCSDSQGYGLERDAEGVCRPAGTWYHYHVRSGVRVTPSGRRVFTYDQSWGEGVPSGPPLPGCPSNCFGVDWAVQDRACRRGTTFALFAVDLWDLEDDRLPMPWVMPRASD